MKKRILCFGDSLTWGFNPHDCSRYEDDVRWTGVFARLLGDDYKVIEEGQNGRTIATDDPIEGEKNGLTYLIPCLDSHMPLDAMVVMLGTNDLKVRFGFTPSDIADEMDRFLGKVKMFNDAVYGGSMKVILMSPPLVAKTMATSCFAESFGYEEAHYRSKELSVLYQRLADKYNIAFINAAEHVSVSDTDSLHLEADQQELLANAVYECYNKLVTR